MNQHRIFKKWLWAGVMGILTILLCLIVSDDLLGLNSPPARSQIGHYVFWVSLIGLPLLFYKFVSWRYTSLNIPLYFLLYYPPMSCAALNIPIYFSKQVDLSVFRYGSEQYWSLPVFGGYKALYI